MKTTSIVLFTFVNFSALPKIQHRADGPSGFDLSQYFNSEKFQEYLKENPSALDYFNLQGQSTSNNAIQSDTMEDSQSQYQIPNAPNYQDYMKNCMSSSPFSSATSSSSSSSSSSAVTSTGGTKAENNPAPWEQFNYNQFGSNNIASYPQQFEKCRKQWESNFPSSSNYQQYVPQNFNGAQNWQPPTGWTPPTGWQPQGGFFPSTSSSSTASSGAGSSTSS